MFTAEQARKLACVTVEEKVGQICKAIESSAKLKHRCLRTGYDYKEDRDLWIIGGYDKTEEWLKAKQILESLGYKVSFYYKEAQYVDMYTLIRW